MRTTRLPAASSAQGRFLLHNRGLVAGLAVTVAVFLLCMLLALLRICLHRTRSATSPKRPKALPPMLEKFYCHTSTSSASSFGCSQSKATTFSPTPVRNQWHTLARAADHRAACNTHSICQSAEVPAPGQSTGTQGREQAVISPASLLEDIGSSLPNDASARRFGLDLERVWLQPLPSAQIERDSLQKQSLWRNSSGGSSCYSRPSSWYSVADTGEPPARELSCGFGAGPGPTIQADQPIDYRHKALPPLPKQESSRCMPSTVAGKQKIEAPRAVLHL